VFPYDAHKRFAHHVRADPAGTAAAPAPADHDAIRAGARGMQVG